MQTNVGGGERIEVKEIEEVKEVEVVKERDEHGKSERILEEFGVGFGSRPWTGTRGDYGK